MFFLVYLDILTQSIAITDSMFNFGKFLTKIVITFDRKKKRYFMNMKFFCASNAAIKNVKMVRKKHFSQNIFNKIAIFPKSTDF